jgi:hypothetical protein
MGARKKKNNRLRHWNQIIGEKIEKVEERTERTERPAARKMGFG